MKKNLINALTIITTATVFFLKTNHNTQSVISNTILDNVEALSQSEELPEVLIECSKDCDDGIGRCWVESKAKKCVWSGYQIDYCSHYPCG